MARSSPRAEPAAGGGAIAAIATPAELARLAEVFGAIDALERCWRDALSYVAGGDADAAAAEVERAEGLLAQIGPLDAVRARLSDGEIVRFAARMQRISALHGELLAASRRAQGALSDELAAARRGRVALDAYAPDAPESCRFDQTG